MTNLNPRVVRDYANRVLINHLLGLEGGSFEYTPDGYLLRIDKTPEHQIIITDEMREWSIAQATKYILDVAEEIRL